MTTCDRLTKMVEDVQEAGSAVMIVSPHLDDAVLSCGALLARLTLTCPVAVVSVFTTAAPPPAWGFAARRQLRLLGAPDAAAHFAERRAEDIAVLKEMGSAWIHLGFRDALFRRVDETATGPMGNGRAAYPTYRFHAIRGRIARSDAGLAAEVRRRIQGAIVSSRATVVFGPLGVGRHVDHLITRHAVEGLELPAIYYSDFPYSETAGPDSDFVRRASLVPCQWFHGRAENSSRMAGYRSQFPGLFPHGVPIRPETYWVPVKASATAT